MAVDPRQVLAGVLTVTMFVMLGNMIKREHFDSYESSDHVETKTVEHNVITKVTSGPWLEDGLELKPCWKKPVLDDPQESEGFITFSLTNGPEYHVSQIADAVVVAKYLQATLVLPDIRGSNPGDKRSFDDIYNSEKFIASLNGVIKVAKTLPTKLSTKNLAVVRVPNRVTRTHIAENIEPIFKSKGNIRLATSFPSVNMRKSGQKSDSDSVMCLAMFGTLELQPEIQEVVNSMVERLRTFSRKNDGRFVAVDLRVDMLGKKGCLESSGLKTKSCYSPSEIALFLRKIGFSKDTTVYLTQSRWDSSLDSLKDLFPKTFTKEGVMAIDMKEKYLSYEISEYEKVIDFYISSKSDVFVPAISGLFYANVAGKRISYGKHQILVPSNIVGSSVSAYVSPYVSKKNHFAYSCFC